jgi:hypothetical protein
MTIGRGCCAVLSASVIALVALSGCHAASHRAATQVPSGLAADLTPPSNDPMSGGVHTVAAAVRVQQGEVFLPAATAHPSLTIDQAFDNEERHLHPSADQANYRLPATTQVRIGYLDVGGARRFLVYALIDEATTCMYTLDPPRHPGTCPSWDFLSASTGLYIAGGYQVPQGT